MGISTPSYPTFLSFSNSGKCVEVTCPVHSNRFIPYFIVVQRASRPFSKIDLRSSAFICGSCRFQLATFSHEPVFADLSTASQILCVSSASRNVGLAGFPLLNPSMKSATWCTNECSYPICNPGTHQCFI